MVKSRPPRVVLSKVGLDGHDRGVKIVARALRDAGMEVIYTGLWQTPERVIRAVADEDADVLGISILSGAHMTLVPILIDLLRQEGLGDVLFLVGGIIPEEDIPKLHEMGVSHVFIPGVSLDNIVTFIREHLPART
ncbi:cobalamin B12-binding domain-containing protein [bacterium]|jgi:methylmalonyl-CoA mutase, C-terminal domain|nr:cobalamin B12-binding domain-containing protein [bacterium]